VELDWLENIVMRLVLVLSVPNHISSPRTKVNIAQNTTIMPCSFNHPLVIGIIMAGTENRNVMKMKTAFTIAAVIIISRVHSSDSRRGILAHTPVKGSRPRSRFVVTLLRVGSCAASF